MADQIPAQSERGLTVRVCPICWGQGVRLAHGRCIDGCRGPDGVIPPMVDVPVVPCDDAAIERVARAIRARNLHLSLPTCFERARAYLAAAGATP